MVPTLVAVPHGDTGTQLASILSILLQICTREGILTSDVCKENLETERKRLRAHITALTELKTDAKSGKEQLDGIVNLCNQLHKQLERRRKSRGHLQFPPEAPWPVHTRKTRVAR